MGEETMKQQSDAQRKAYDRAFNEGQQAWRDGKSKSDNPYPPEAPYNDGWAQGWQEECDLETS
jgi:ribosome modulation factor